jgi:hypothetical protein
MRMIMKLASVVSAAFLLGSVSMAAQNTGQPQVTTLTAQVQPDSCPVSLRAQHGADGNMMKVDKNRPQGFAQLLHLILTSKDSRQIVEARLRVRGTSGKGRLRGADGTADDVNAIRNVTVRLRAGEKNESSGSVWVPGMTSVMEVDLTSVSYSDGSVTRFNDTNGCRFTPEHVMLIADHNSR